MIKIETAFSTPEDVTVTLQAVGQTEELLREMGAGAAHLALSLAKDIDAGVPGVVEMAAAVQSHMWTCLRLWMEANAP